VQQGRHALRDRDIGGVFEVGAVGERGGHTVE
jgi:hypothetical protein